MEQPEKTVLVYVFDGFADWESAYVCAELGRAERCEPSPPTASRSARWEG